MQDTMRRIGSSGAPPIGRRLAIAVLVIGLAGAIGPVAGAATVRSARAATVEGSGEAFPAEPVVVRAAPDAGADSYVGAVNRSKARTAPRLSDIQVTYHGLPTAAQGAVELAASLWERLVKSTVPIRVDASWAPAAGGELGEGGPTTMVRNFAGAPHSNVLYPVAEANARSSRDLDPTHADAVLAFNSNVAWSTVAAGPATGKFDLTTVAMHELGHALGFTDSFSVSGGVGRWGSGGSPTAFDRLVVDAAGTPIIDFGNDNTTVAAKLTSGQVYFSGAQAKAEHFGLLPPLYAPGSYDDGSSIAHFDETRFAFTSSQPDSLMTPFLGMGEVIRDPGDIALGVLRDIGWTTTALQANVPAALAAPIVSAGDGRMVVSWAPPTVSDRVPTTTFTIGRLVNGQTNPDVVATVGAGVRSWTDTNLGTATTFRYRVTATNPVGVGAPSELSKPAKPLVLGPFVDVDALIDRQFTDIAHRHPTAAELVSYRDRLDTGALDRGAVVVELMRGTTHTASVPPVVRLYLAYFKRLPDESGLAYWAGKLRAGKGKGVVSASFASSTEFTRTYGSLSDAAFVQLVYRNVLGRDPDSSGSAYWVGKLAGGYPRGSVMTGFSESSENMRATATVVDVVGLYHVLLGRVPTASELATDRARVDAGTTLATRAAELLVSRSYYARLGVALPPRVSFVLHGTIADSSFRLSSVGHGDLDGDGRQDLVTAFQGTNALVPTELRVSLQTGGGVLAAPVKVDVPGYAREVTFITVADVSGDGHADVVLSTTGGILLYKGSATGALAASSIPVGYLLEGNGHPLVQATVGDLTGDGRPDIVAASSSAGANKVWVFAQNSAGGLSTAVSYPLVHEGVVQLGVGDVNGDGRTDLVAAVDPRSGGPAGHASVLLQQADGTLGAEATLTPTGGLEAGALAVGDFTGDGRADVALANVTAGGVEQVTLYRGQVSGVLALVGNVAGKVMSMEGADLDSDGRADLTTLGPTGVVTALLQKAAGGGFDAPLAVATVPQFSYSVGTGSVAVGDLTGDGKPDIVALYYGESGLAASLLAQR